MSAGTWGGRAIDPRVREAALEAARRHGLQLGGWLGDALQAHDDKDPMPQLDVEDADVSRAAGRRIADALERLAQRIETAEQRASLAVVGLDRTVVGLASRIDDTEVGAREEALRLFALVGELKSAQESLIDRLASAESEERIGSVKRAVERIDAELTRLAYRLEGDLARLAERLDGTGDAVAASIAAVRDDAEASLAHRDARLDAVDHRLTAFETQREHAQDALHDVELALRAAVEDVDARLGGRLAETHQAAFARLEDLGVHLAEFAAETTQSQAASDARIDQVSADVQARIAQLNADGEQRAADAERRAGEAAKTELEALDQRVADALADLRANVERASARAAAAEDAAETAARALAGSVQALGARIDAAQASAADALSNLKTDLDAAIDDRVGALAASVGTLQAAVDDVVETLRPADLNNALIDVQRRMSAAEGRQSQTVEAVSVEIKRLSEAFDRRMRVLEETHQKAELPRLVEKLQAQSEQRYAAADARALEAAAALSARLDTLGSDLAAARAELARQVGAVASDLETRLHSRLDGALDEVDARLSAIEHARAREAPELGIRSASPIAAPLAIAPAFAAAPPEEPVEVAPAPPRRGVWGPEQDEDLEIVDEPALAASALVVDEPRHIAEYDSEDDDFRAFESLRRRAPAEPLGATDASASPVDEWALPDDTAELDAAFEDERLAPEPATRSRQSLLPDNDEVDAPAARREPALLDTDPDLDVLEAEPPPAQPKSKNAYLSDARRAAMAAATPSKTRGGRPRLSPRVLIVGALGATAAAAGGVAFMLRPSDAPTEQPPAPPPHAATLSGPPGSIAEAAAKQAEAPAVVAEAPKETLDQAVQRGDAVATFELARQKLAGGAADEGFALMRKAADKGLAAAQHRLAKLYERGEGVPADIAAARQWTERAAMGGNRSAMHDLGVYFARGEGAPLNEAQAYRWFRQAADLGMTNSQYNLGVLYQTGRGVAADQSEALFWFAVASAADDSDARARAAAIEQRLTPAVAAQIRARAAAFRPRLMNPRANGDFGPLPWPKAGAGAGDPSRT
jgi:localization factor PodJL